MRADLNAEDERVTGEMRETLAGCLRDWGFPCEADNVAAGIDLDSYETSFRLMRKLEDFGLLDYSPDRAQGGDAESTRFGVRLLDVMLEKGCSQKYLQAVGTMLGAASFPDRVHPRDLAEAIATLSQQGNTKQPTERVFAVPADEVDGVNRWSHHDAPPPGTDYEVLYRKQPGQQEGEA